MSAGKLGLLADSKTASGITLGAVATLEAIRELGFTPSEMGYLADSKRAFGLIISAGAGAVATVETIRSLGFARCGIAAKSWAAKFMSREACLNGGGVPPGGIAAVFKRIGARGLTTEAP